MNRLMLCLVLGLWLSPSLATDPGTNFQVYPLSHGLVLRAHLSAGLIERAPTVERVPVPTVQVAGLRPMGTAYRIRWHGPLPTEPVELDFPLPGASPRELVGAVVARIDGEMLSLLQPIRVDPERNTVTLVTRKFSVWVPLVPISTQRSSTEAGR